MAGFLSETIQGVGGATPLADGYLAEAYKVCGHGSKGLHTSQHVFLKSFCLQTYMLQQGIIQSLAADL